MFIWDYAANPVMESIMDWCYSQIVLQPAGVDTDISSADAGAGYNHK